MDEVRVYASGVVLSAGWVAAEYANQSNPATFFTVVPGTTNSGGTPPVVTVVPASLAFGSQTTGTTSSGQSVTVPNTGPGTLTISSVAVTGGNASDFAGTTTCPVSPATP